MTVSKNGSHSTGAAEPSSDPEQARSRAVSPLRQRMIGDMELAGLSSSTQQCYLGAVVALQQHTDTRPDRLTEEQVYQYVLWLHDEKGVTKGTFQPHWHGIKFFYYRTLGVDWPLFPRKKVRPPRRRRLPLAIFGETLTLLGCYAGVLLDEVAEARGRESFSACVQEDLGGRSGPTYGQPCPQGTRCLFPKRETTLRSALSTDQDTWIRAVELHVVQT